MNGYELSRNWFDWSFENPELVTPGHTAIYFFAIEQCNRLGWKEKFGFPSQMAMDAVGIRKHGTFAKYFNDLVEWGFLKLIEKSKNQYSANIISLQSAIPENGKALGKATQKHGDEQGKSTGQSTGQSKGSIDKPKTFNQEPKTNNEDFEKFRKEYPGQKRGFETEFKTFQKHKDWKEVLPLLSENLKKQIEIRNAKLARKEFVPEWPMLSTYLNQRRWEIVPDIAPDVFHMINSAHTNRFPVSDAMRRGFNKNNQ